VVEKYLKPPNWQFSANIQRSTPNTRSVIIKNKWTKYPLPYRFFSTFSLMTATSFSIDSALGYLPSSALDASPNQQILPLTAKVNDRDCLEIGGCDVTDLVEKFGSPLYILDEQSMRSACTQYRDAWQQYYGGESLVIYASKAWNCLAVCAIVKSEGLGIDVVSSGELAAAIQVGFAPSNIYFHGNNKSIDELKTAIACSCNIVADNWWELENISKLAVASSKTVPVMIRLTPGIECHTHEYIRTGQLDSKFGFDPDRIDDVLVWLSKQSDLQCIGVHAHIGSQIFEQQPHQDLAAVMVDWYQKAIALDLPVTQINVGGGLGIKYTEADDPQSIDAWVKNVATALKTVCDSRKIGYPKVICEPGRSLIGSSCVTAYTIGGNKVIPQVRTYISIDGGMSDNPRPITYQSVYRAIVANKMSAPMSETVTIAGKHCESGDVLIKNAQIAPTQPGDILVVPATGAYNYSMASNYNRIARPAAIIVGNAQAAVIIERETDADLLRHDRLPSHLS
jgi:diaminopimelate decarboxylase